MSRLTDLIDVVLPISNKKLADLAMFLLSWIELSSCFNTFSWSISFIDRIEILESMKNSLNLVSLYYELVDELKT